MTVDERPEAAEHDAPVTTAEIPSAMERLERLAPRRPSHWDRPAPPRDWRWVAGTVGKVLIATGVLMFGFVGYQLWGTGIEYAQAQDDLDAELANLLSGSTVSTTAPGAEPATTSAAEPQTSVVPQPSPTTVVPGPATTSAPATASPPVAPVEPGSALGFVEVPAIGVKAAIVEGVSRDDLKRAPGHYPGTPMPGQLGNAAIAGHRTTYGAPFKELDELDIGDEIIVTTTQGRFVYRMTARDIVAPDNSQVISTVDATVARLTLTTCEPEYSARDRLIVFADLVVEESPAPAAYTPPAPPPPQGSPQPTLPGEAGEPGVPGVPGEEGITASTVAGDEPDATDEEAADAFAQGWFSDPRAFEQVALWGSLLTFIGVGAYALSWRTRRNWVGALAGIVPFLIVAYFFFQNVNRLLPAAL